MIGLLLLNLILVRAENIYKVEIKNHILNPSEISVIKNEDVLLEITNNDFSTEEIESKSLNFEKIIPPKKTVKIRIKRITEGSHDIFGEFYQSTCQGKILAK